MALLRARNAALLLKIEGVEGTFSAPSNSTDGILVEAPTINTNPQNVETDEVTGSLDGRGPIVGGTQCAINFAAYIKGTGTPGAAPEFGDALKICGYAETITATDISGTTFSASGPSTINDSGSGMAALTVGTVIHVSGFANAANNGEFLVATSAAGSITVTKVDGSSAGLVNESAGPTITLRRGIAAVAATAGTTSSFTAQAPWAATDQIYRGMPVLVSGNPATPQFAFIADYTTARVATLTDLFGVALDTSSKVSIPAHVRYQPTSASIPTASIEFYMDGVRYRFAGCRGNVTFEMTAAGAWKANFALTGLFVSKADAAVPTVTYDGTRPGTWRNSSFLIQRLAASLRSWTVETGNELPYPPDPNQVEGFGVPVITRRRMSGRMDPHATLVATRDIMADFRAGTERIIHGRLRGSNASVAGNRGAMTVPKAFYEAYQPTDDQGLATEQAGFFCKGEDAGAQLVIW